MGVVFYERINDVFLPLSIALGIQIKHSVIDASDSTIITAKDKENAETLNFTPYWKL